MKKPLLLILFSISIHSLFAQYVFPNFSFENWTAGEVDGWNTNNAAGVTVPVTQSTDAHSGNFAVKGEVTNFNTWTAPNFGSDGCCLFEINQEYATLNFYYKFNKLNNDVIVVTAQLNTAHGWPVGFVNARITDNASTYTPIAIPITYLPGDSVPGEMGILIGIQDTVLNTATPGSYFIFDDFSLGWFTALEVEENIFAEENVKMFSSPATDFISFSVPEKNPSNTVSVVDITGKQVVKSFTSKTARTDIPATDLSDGIYFLNIRNGENLRVKKIVVLH
jgi:hypothetical protein